MRRVLLIAGLALLLPDFLPMTGALAGAPLPTSNEVQRITPSRCPLGTTPVINSQTNGAAGTPATFTTTAKVIAGNGNRQIYSFLFETTDARCEYGTTLDGAPGTTPTTTVGFLYKANTLYWEDTYPGNRMDCACTSGTCTIDTEECNP